jgi:diacylglycerol kinase (ATP)
MFGDQAYLACALWMLPSWPAPRLCIRGDFGEREGPYLLAAAGNTTRYGGGIMMTPHASPHDGLLDCCLIRDLWRVRALALLPQTYSGSHGRYAEVEMVRSRVLEIEAESQVFVTADGELMGESRAVIEVAPDALLIQGGVQ